jgi:hypothetical protein
VKTWRVVNVRPADGHSELNVGWKLPDKEFERLMRRGGPRSSVVLVDTENLYVRWWDDTLETLQIFFVEEVHR